MRSRTEFWRDAFLAALIAGITGGIPSTAFALLTGGDVLEPTRAARSGLSAPLRLPLIDVKLFRSGVLLARYGRASAANEIG